MSNNVNITISVPLAVVARVKSANDPAAVREADLALTATLHREENYSAIKSAIRTLPDHDRIDDQNSSGGSTASNTAATGTAPNTSPGAIRVSLKLPSGDSIKIDIFKYMTCTQLAEQIERVTGVQARYQLIRHNCCPAPRITFDGSRGGSAERANKLQLAEVGIVHSGHLLELKDLRK